MRPGADARADKPVVLEVPDKGRGRLHRLNLFSVEIDRPNVTGTVGASLAWRREAVPGRSIPTVGSMMTIRLAVRVNLRTSRRTIKRSRSFFFALGGENGRKTVDRRAFDDEGEADEVREAPGRTITQSEPVAEPEPVLHRESSVTPEPVIESEPVVPYATVEHPLSTTNGRYEHPATDAAHVEARNGVDELDELLSAMQRTQREPAPAAGPIHVAYTEPGPARERSPMPPVVDEPVRTAPPRAAKSFDAEQQQGDDAELHPILRRRPPGESTSTPTRTPEHMQPATQVVEERLVEERPRDEPAAQPPPGWYPDPTGSAELRYWDGRWTAHVKTKGRLSWSPLAGSSQ